MKIPASRDELFSRQAYLLYALLALALLLRLWYLVEVVQAPDYRELRQDMSVQDYQARAMLSGDWTLPPDRSDPRIPDTPYYRPPGYTYLLAALYWISGGSYLAPRLFNIALGLLSILLTVRLARHLFNSAAALLSAALMATYWGFIYYEGEVNDPAIFVFLLPCLFLTLHRWGATRAARWAALAGLITGCYALMRPNILLFGPFMAAWMLWLCWRTGQWRAAAAAWLALAGTTALVIIPVTVRNYVVSGEFVPISTYYGENLYIGFSDDSDGVTSWTPYLQHLEGSGRFSVWEYDHIVKGLGREVGNENLTHSEASKIFARMAQDWIRTHPREALHLVLKKAVLFWSPWEITENKVVHYEKAHYAPLKYLPGFPYLFALFFSGLVWLGWDGLRRRFSEPTNMSGVRASDMLLILSAFLFTYYVSFFPFFVNARARHPMAGMMCLVGAYGLYRLGVCYREGGLKRMLPGVLLLTLFFGAGCLDPYRYTPDRARWHYARADSWLRDGKTDQAAAEAERMLGEAYSYYMPFRLGHAFALKGRHELAARLLHAALSEDAAEQPAPYRQDLYFHIGASLAAVGKDSEARDAFEESLRLNPRDARAHNDLGVLVEKQGDREAALRHYRAALEARPDFALAASNLCDLLGRMGQAKEAVAACEQAVAAAPTFANHHYNLAVQLAQAGDVPRAMDAYRETLALAPDDVRALNNLALLYAEQPDGAAQAERLYRQALDLDPAYVLARANLGNLYIARGRVEEGIDVYREGLAQAPEQVELLNGLGFQLANLGRYEEARVCYEQALDIRPEYLRADINLAWLLLRTGDPNAARGRFQALLERHPENPYGWLEWGKLLEQTGDAPGAIAAMRRALALNPALSEAADRLNALESQ